jgi:hypothetical protein
MINFLPPTGPPQAAEQPDGRGRREGGADFGDWLKSQAEGTPAAAPGPAASALAQAGEAQREYTGRDPRILLQDAQPPHPRPRAEALPTRPYVASAEPPAPQSEAPAPQLPELHANPHATHDRLEGVSFPWRLLANLGMSYAGTGVGSPAVLANGLPAPSVAPADGAIETTAPGTPLRCGTDGAPSPRLQQVLECVGPMERPPRVGGLDPQQRLERLQQWIDAHPDWPERLLRWFGEDADITAWVRDFQLGEVELSELVNKLREYVQEHGRPLARIIHNGRVVWRANHQSQENGSES